ncbi:MAG: hypothetical protein HC938_09220 [Nitrospira sp.]|nr:hypothetical protein [Nitrospira sp.]
MRQAYDYWQDQPGSRALPVAEPKLRNFCARLLLNSDGNGRNPTFAFTGTTTTTTATATCTRASAHRGARYTRRASKRL